jgi:hypothetical protein
MRECRRFFGFRQTRSLHTQEWLSSVDADGIWSGNEWERLAEMRGLLKGAHEMWGRETFFRPSSRVRSILC